MKELVVTTSWDDGTTSDLKLAEILNKYGLKATLYISRDKTQSLLQESDIVGMSKQFEIGSHTINHPDLTKLSPSEADKEIGASKKYLEELLGHNVPMFCYPYGTYNDELKQILKNHGFIGARACIVGGFNLPQDPYRWHITLFASNRSPLMALKICWQARLWKIGGLLDWESRAKLLFDSALKEGGVYHMYGHSSEFEEDGTWDKLERVFAYISNRENVKYQTNGEILRSSALRTK